jgi:lysophospholipase L1-like esterase
MIHIGTNDCWSGRTTEETIDAFTFALRKNRAKNPNVYILLCQILPLNPSGGSSCPACPGRVTALNTALATWAQQHTTSASPIVIVDQWTGFNTATDTDDGAHPNAKGNEKMATKFLKPLETAIAAKSK